MNTFPYRTLMVQGTTSDAGKTTVVEIIEGHRTADSGDVRVLGHDPARRERALRERIGIVLQEAGFDEDATVAELVRLHRNLYPRRLDADAVICITSALRDHRSGSIRSKSERASLCQVHHRL